MSTTRPLLSRKHFPQARNTVDHVRGDRKDELKTVGSIVKAGRFHAETPRSFTSKAPQPKHTESRIRTSVTRPVDHIQRLLHGCTPTATGPAASNPRDRPAPLRRSASYTTSRDHPFSPVRHAEARKASDDSEFGKLQRSSSSIGMSQSQRFWEANEPVNHRGVRTSYNSGLQTARVVQPAKQQATPRPNYRSASPTFTRSNSAAPEHRVSIRTTIPAFEPQELPRRSMTPTRRHPYPGGLRPSQVFAVNTVDDNKLSVDRLRSTARRAATPQPPSRGRCELSIVDSPAVEPPMSKRHAASPAQGRHNGVLPPADSVRRSSSRNQSSIVFNWQ